MMEENVEHPQRFNDFHFFEELFELISSYGSWVIYCGMFPSHRLETDFFPPCLKRFFHLLIQNQGNFPRNNPNDPIFFVYWDFLIHPEVQICIMPKMATFVDISEGVGKLNSCVPLELPQNRQGIFLALFACKKFCTSWNGENLMLLNGGAHNFFHQLFKWECNYIKKIKYIYENVWGVALHFYSWANAGYRCRRMMQTSLPD